MSDDEHSDSSSDGEDIEATGLIATRQKRATAGNLYATLRANLDDEELQKELLAEDEEGDAGDYEGSDKGEEDEELESSSDDDEDAGPPKAGEAEDLEGEKALKRQERVEAKKKRKATEARLKLPAWQKKQKTKRVTLADDVKTEDGSMSERPRKKSERSNWLPTASDAPVRQSGRASAVANRETVHAHLKQSAERSERQRRVMKDAAEREKTKKRMLEMTQEERLKKCERIERETAREFGRWEREEAERQRLREEALAAKRKRGVDGPFVRYWSGSVLWEGERIKVRRVSHGSRKVEELGKEDEKKEENALDAYKRGELAKDGDAGTSGATLSDDKVQLQNEEAEPKPKPNLAEQASDQSAVASTPAHDNPTQAPVPWLQGIQAYAAQPEASPAPTIPMNNSYIPSAPAINGHPQQPTMYSQPYWQPQEPSQQIYHGWPPGTHQFPVNQPQPHQQHPLPPAQAIPPPPPAPPLLREQAQRTLIILSQFPSLDTTSTTTSTKRASKLKSTTTNPDTHTADSTTTASNPLKSLLLPTSYPPPPSLPYLTAEESKYLTTKPRKRTNLNEHPLPPPPAKLRCAITSWTAKYRDPKTGLAYADMHQYKAVQRVLAGGCAWSAVLGAFVGPAYGALGRPAKGVPAGFAVLEERV